MSREQFARLLEPMMDRAYGMCFSLTRRSDEAENLLQEAALRAFRSFHTFQPGTNFKAWFYKILTNLFYEKHRRSRSEPGAVSLDEPLDLLLYKESQRIGLHERSHDPAAEVFARLSNEAIQASLSGLPDEYRTVCVLYFLHDFSYQEIADISDVPLGTVRSRLHRGRRLLQKSLVEEAREVGLKAALEVRS